MHEGSAELNFPPANSGTPSVDPVFNFWTSSKHAVLCSPYEKAADNLVLYHCGVADITQDRQRQRLVVK